MMHVQVICIILPDYCKEAVDMICNNLVAIYVIYKCMVLRYVSM